MLPLLAEVEKITAEKSEKLSQTVKKAWNLKEDSTKHRKIL